MLAGLASGAPGDPRRDLKPADQAYARSILLRRADLPAGTWKATPTDFSGANPPCQVAHYNLSALTLNGEAGYDYFRAARPLGIETEADVFASAAQAARAFAVSNSAGFIRCALASRGTTIVGLAPLTLRLTSGRVPPGVRSAGFQALLRQRTAHGRVTEQILALDLLRGRTIASVVAIRSDLSPPTFLPALVLETLSRMTRSS